MNKIVIFLVVWIFLVMMLFAGEDKAVEVEKSAIKQAVLDYIEGWYDGDPVRMERALHPEYLTKRGIFIDPESKETSVRVLDAKMMIEYTKRGGGKNFPREKLKENEVVILDIYKNTATVKALSTQYVDYLHLAKFNGEWKIVNVIWEFRSDIQ